MPGRRGHAAAGLTIRLLALAALPVGALASGPTGHSSGLDPAVLSRFETSLEELRQQLKIPGLAAAIVSDGQLAWARGLGHADVQRDIPATADTPFHLASVTKPFAAVVALQLVEEGVLDLDDPVSDYGLDYHSPGVIRVRHLLSHSSRGEPGTEFRYDSERFADLGWLLKRASGQSFRQLLVDRILAPLEMECSAPTPLSMGDGALAPFRIWLDPGNARVSRRLARPYALDRSFAIVDGHAPIIFSPASGLVASVSDLARFDIALDENRLLPEAAQARMFSPAVTPEGRVLPYGLGWFSQTHEGTRLVWHYGWNPPTASALYLKVPDEGLTFIALANTDAMSRPFDLGGAEATVLDSTVALTFYEIVVLEGRRGRRLPPIDWEGDEEGLVGRLRGSEERGRADLRERELRTYRRLFHSMGRDKSVARLEAVHARVYSRSPPPGRNELLALGEHLLPWPSVPLFGMGHVTAWAWFLLIVVSTLGLRAVQAARDRLRGPHRPREPGGWDAGRATTVLATLAVFGGTALYVGVLSRWPQEGPVAWLGGTPLARGLIAAAAASGVLALGVVLRAVAPRHGRRQWTLARLGQVVFASGVCAGAWVLLDLAGWL